MTSFSYGCAYGRWPRREESIYRLLFRDRSTKVRTPTEMDGLEHAA